MTSRCILVGILALASGPLPAQRTSNLAQDNPAKPYVEATGEGKLSVQPDQAVIQVGVVSQAKTAADAGAQSARQTEAMISGLKSILGSAGQIRTTNYNLRPDYQTPKPGSAPTISGYSATNVVEVTLDDLTKISPVIDMATQTGGNTIQGLEYQLKDPSKVRAQALRLAAVHAKEAAQQIAEGIGAKVVGILSSAEVTGDSVVYPKRPVAFAAAARSETPTPVEIGPLDVTANVIVRLEISQ